MALVRSGECKVASKSRLDGRRWAACLSVLGLFAGLFAKNVRTTLWAGRVASCAIVGALFMAGGLVASPLAGAASAGPPASPGSGDTPTVPTQNVGSLSPSSSGAAALSFYTKIDVPKALKFFNFGQTINAGDQFRLQEFYNGSWRVIYQKNLLQNATTVFFYVGSVKAGTFSLRCLIRRNAKVIVGPTPFSVIVNGRPKYPNFTPPPPPGGQANLTNQSLPKIPTNTGSGPATYGPWGEQTQVACGGATTGIFKGWHNEIDVQPYAMPESGFGDQWIYAGFWTSQYVNSGWTNWQGQSAVEADITASSNIDFTNLVIGGSGGWVTNLNDMLTLPEFPAYPAYEAVYIQYWWYNPNTSSWDTDGGYVIYGQDNYMQFPAVTGFNVWSPANYCTVNDPVGA